MPSRSDLCANELKVAVRRRALGPEGQGGRAFVFFEVSIEGRRADAISVDLWRSRDQLIQGYEIKVSRADWLNELRDPEKAAPAVAACDRFWLVTPPDIVRPGELPETWGHLVLPGPRLRMRVEKRAPKLAPPGPDRDFWMILMKRAWFEGAPTNPYVPVKEEALSG